MEEMANAPIIRVLDKNRDLIMIVLSAARGGALKHYITNGSKMVSAENRTFFGSKMK
ncbi:hypothetical protein [Capsulimonas corticalis]|uniref:hypothetical protein n=1 Tax=Capsulimonas corticalis TaxID=2219043 RepID=UPI000FFAAE0A|nr:hypothetical protein [Capsulimonas corticalis]